jgi:hypothetical protein
LVPCGPIGPPAPVNSGVRLFANTRHSFASGVHQKTTEQLDIVNSMFDPNHLDIKDEKLNIFMAPHSGHKHFMKFRHH